MLHQWFICIHLLITYLANLTEGFQLSFTTYRFPSKQHKVVCYQLLQAESGRPTTISSKVTRISFQSSRLFHAISLVTHFLVAKVVIKA